MTVLNLGRARFAREKAEELLEPGEVADETAGSWPIYMYKARRIAECVLLTPEEQDTVNNACRALIDRLHEGLRLISPHSDGREAFLQTMKEIEKVRKVQSKLPKQAKEEEEE